MGESPEQAETRRWRQVAHLFGFVDGRRSDVEVSFHDGSVAEVANAVMEVQRGQGYEPVVKSSLRTLDGWLVAVEYEVPNKPPFEHMPMWHVFRRPREQWPTALTAAQPGDGGDAAAGEGA